MAKMTIYGFDELAQKLDKLGNNSINIAKKAVMAAAVPVANEVRKNLIANIKDPGYVGKGDNPWGTKAITSTGDLLESFGITPPDVDKNGYVNTKVGFAGYDRKGVPNALKARAMESGTSTLKKRPFMRPAINKTRKKALSEMGRVIDEEIKIYAL